MIQTDEPGGPGVDYHPRRHFRQIAGRRVSLDQEGFLWNADDWCEDIAAALAAESGLTSLDEEHWRVLRFLRGFYAYHGRSPLNQQLASGTGMPLLKLERLFPGGIKNGARRLAGLPNPKSC